MSQQGQGAPVQPVQGEMPQQGGFEPPPPEESLRGVAPAVSPAPELMGVFAEQATLITKAMSQVSGIRAHLENHPQAPDDVLEALDRLQTQYAELFETVGWTLGTFNEWIKADLP